MVAGSGLAEFLNSSIFSSPGAEHPRWLPPTGFWEFEKQSVRGSGGHHEPPTPELSRLQ